MTPKQLIIPGFAALCCVSCSNDNDLPGGDSHGKATLSVKVKTSGFTQKQATADPNALPGELNINDLTAIVFDETGNSLLGDPMRLTTVSSTEGIAVITGIPVKSVIGQLVLIANAPASLLDGLTTLSALQTKLASLTDQSQNSLTMSTRLITTKQHFTDGTNYIGFDDQINVDGLNVPIELTRIAARVDVVHVSANLASSPIAGRTITVNYIYLYDQRISSYYFSPTYWGAVMFDDVTNYKEGSSIRVDKPVDDNTILTGVSFRNYTMENTNKTRPTKVVVSATIEAQGEYLEQTKLFMAVINANGLNNGYDHNYVKRNYIYRVSLGFSGTSFSPITPPLPPEPETGDLDVKVEVVGWGPVDQNVEIE